MREKSGVLALLAGALTVVLMTGCGPKHKAEQVSVVDENHFDQLASTSSEAPGNASSTVEVLGGETAAQGASLAQQAGIPADAAAEGTIAAATTAATASTTAPAAASSTTAIQPASSTEIVSVKPTATYEEKVQAALKNAGFYSGAIDGKIGSKTREAIRAFQAGNGLKADGVVGPGTWEKLKKHLSHA
jgi:murein L,D-transpeptidase YcbB/YkuD